MRNEKYLCRTADYIFRPVTLQYGSLKADSKSCQLRYSGCGSQDLWFLRHHLYDDTDKTERFSKLNNLMIEKLDQLKKMQEEMIANIFGDDYQDNQLIICQPNGRPIMQEQLNRKFKDIIVEMRENGYKFTSVPEDKLDDVVFHSVRAASATKKMQVSNGNLKAVMRAGGWAEPDMVIRYSKAYDDDQVKIAQKMEEDYHKGGDAKPQQDAEELLRIIQDNPELLTKLLAAIKP